jgi:LmbE family N-acetylglucosaminyl deacetylase
MAVRVPDMNASDLGAYVPYLRPHNQRRGNEVFFLISRRPIVTLSDNAVDLYNSIDGRQTVSQLAASHLGTVDYLKNWWERALIELLPPTAAPTSPHLVVIEPHMDDAVLSAGGRLLRRRGHYRITIVSVAQKSNFTSYLTQGRPFINVSQVSDLRQQESAIVAKLLGARHVCLEWADAPLRHVREERWCAEVIDNFKTAPHIFTNLVPAQHDVSRLAMQLSELLETLGPDELWIPMGLGNHTDHRMTRSACLRLLVEGRQHYSRVSVSMYEDLPYASADGHAAKIRSELTKCGGRLVRATEDITDLFEEKLRLVSIYGSQFKLFYMEPAIRRFAEYEGGDTGRLAEAYTTIDEIPIRVPLESSVSHEAVGLAALATKARLLLSKRLDCRHLTFLILPSGSFGLLRVDSDNLVKTFPNCTFSVYIPADLTWQMTDVCDDNGRWTVRVVHGGWRAWCWTILREFFRFGVPEVVLWRGAYAASPGQKLKHLVNCALRLLLPCRTILFARTLRDLYCTLSDQVDHDLV